MNPMHWTFRTRFFTGFLICVALMAYALYAQYVQFLDPCPLCIFQRVAVVFMGLFFLLGAIHGPRDNGRWIYTGLVLVGAVGGIVTAGRHLWLQTLPASEVPSCGPGLGYMLDSFPLSRALKLAFTGSGECAKVEPVLGLPMPAWTLIWFVLLGAWAIWAALRRRS
jgi:protein dithiol:quinone oxidoreductase